MRIGTNLIQIFLRFYIFASSSTIYDVHTRNKRRGYREAKVSAGPKCSVSGLLTVFMCIHARMKDEIAGKNSSSSSCRLLDRTLNISLDIITVYLTCSNNPVHAALPPASELSRSVRVEESDFIGRAGIERAKRSYFAWQLLFGKYGAD